MLSDWVNPHYLKPDVINRIRQSVMAKPTTKYTVLDDFFKEEMLDILIEQHKTLEFSERQDRYVGDNKLPYDGAVVFANQSHIGADLFFGHDWHSYCCYLLDAPMPNPTIVEVKLRHHRPDADGFWIHTDGTIRSLVAICYFNKGWKASDGGLLQLWRPLASTNDAPEYNNPKGRMDFLAQHTIIKTRAPGGGFADGQVHDMILVDQVVPEYNRLFLCSYHNDPAYHSVTPSNGRERTGFVQWLKTHQ